MFDGREFLRLAIEMLSVDGDEAVARTVAGRAYYAVYHVGRKYIESTGGSLSRGPAGHKQLADLLGRDNEVLVEILDRLRRFRNSADYDVVLAIDPATMATVAVSLANEIIGAIDGLSAARR